VSPKRQVLWLIIIFSSLGLGVSVAIIATGGGFSGPGASLTNPPTSKDIWTLGENIRKGTILNYSLTGASQTSALISAKVSINFVELVDSDWSVRFAVNNGSSANTIQDTLVLSKQMTKKGQIDQAFRPYFEPIQSSILDISNIAIGPKYLVVGAPWETIITGSNTVTARIATKETVLTRAGSFNSFTLTYKLGSNTSKIWLVRDIPLPVKAEVYNAEDQLEYKYDLLAVYLGT